MVYLYSFDPQALTSLTSFYGAGIALQEKRFDPQALTSLTDALPPSCVCILRFDPQALTSLTTKIDNSVKSVDGFDPQALTSLTYLPVYPPVFLAVSIHRLLRA